MQATPTYDVYQQIFSLSLLSNSATFFLGTQEQLQQQLANEVAANLENADVQQAIGTWSVVWGPVVWQNTGSKVVDNAMFVAHNPEVRFADGSVRDTYVVAIAATNAQSGYDWFVEDFSVGKVVKLGDYNPFEGPPSESFPSTEPTISIGTATGIYRLAQLVVPSGFPAAGTNIAQFLQGLSGVSGSTVIFTGHSLAGALSPTLALWLKTNNQVGSFETVYVYPTAGATPGNPAFATLFDEQFAQSTPGEEPHQVWNTMLWNLVDVVPHAWNVSDLKEVKTLYGNGTILELSALIDFAIGNSEKSLTRYTRIRNQSLPGAVVSVNNNTNPPTELVVPPTDLKQFAQQALYQHVAAYNDLIGVHLPKVSVPLVPGVTQTTEQKALDQLIVWIIEWLLGKEPKA